MQAIDPLMSEHRLIERMLSVMKEVLTKVEKKHRIDPDLVDIAVDFVKIYADRTHHGKEEDILFCQLADKPLSPQDRQIMNDLIQEHVYARRTTQSIVDANSRYRGGEEDALTEIAHGFRQLVEFYPKHIDKEDKMFFPASRQYFSDAEDEAMLASFWEFDRQMIHEKYEAIVRRLEGLADR